MLNHFQHETLNILVRYLIFPDDDSSIALSRLQLSPGERAEILVNFSGMISQTVFLKSFASELPVGIYGAYTVGAGIDTIADYSSNFLNGVDFNLLKINVVAQTASPIISIPINLIPFMPFNIVDATVNRTIVMDTIRLLPLDVPNRAEGPFGLNNKSFDLDSVNEIVNLNSTEVWTLRNKTLLAHPFHIHDVQFNIIEKSGVPPPANEKGWKDVVLVMPNDSVKFITKFSDFADNTTPYMYHCHLLHHEDDGMMGSFLVVDTASTGITSLTLEDQTVKIYPNPTTGLVNIISSDNATHSFGILNSLGQKIYFAEFTVFYQLPIDNFSSGVYFIQVNSEEETSTFKIIKQ